MEKFEDLENQENQPPNVIIRQKKKKQGGRSQKVLPFCQTDNTYASQVRKDDHTMEFMFQRGCRPDIAFNKEKPRLKNDPKLLETIEETSENVKSIELGEYMEDCVKGIVINEKKEFGSSCLIKKAQALKGHNKDTAMLSIFQKDCKPVFEKEYARFKKESKPMLKKTAIKVEKEGSCSHSKESFCNIVENDMKVVTPQKLTASCNAKLCQCLSPDESQHSSQSTDISYERFYSLRDSSSPDDAANSDLSSKSFYTTALETPNSNNMDKGFLQMLRNNQKESYTLIGPQNDLLISGSSDVRIFPISLDDAPYSGDAVKSDSSDKRFCSTTLETLSSDKLEETDANKDEGFLMRSLENDQNESSSSNESQNDSIISDSSDERIFSLSLDDTSNSDYTEKKSWLFSSPLSANFHPIEFADFHENNNAEDVEKVYKDLDTTKENAETNDPTLGATLCGNNREEEEFRRTNPSFLIRREVPVFFESFSTIDDSQTDLEISSSSHSELASSYHDDSLGSDLNEIIIGMKRMTLHDSSQTDAGEDSAPN